MALVKDYISMKINDLGVQKNMDVEMLMGVQNLDPEAELNSATITSADKVVVDAILSLLIMPDISEGDFSVKYDRNALMRWYQLQVKRLGLDDHFSPEVRDMSSLA